MDTASKNNTRALWVLGIIFCAIVTVSLTGVLSNQCAYQSASQDISPYAGGSVSQNKFGYSEALAPNSDSQLRARNHVPSIDVPAYRPVGISASSAPDVAFTYRYAFLLPDAAIAAVQEQHASECEKMGPTQCRVIGMRYKLVEEDQVEAYLLLKLSRNLARQFGKDRIETVEKADGKLIDAEIQGTDVGSQISASEVRSDTIRASIAVLEKRLRENALPEAERRSIQGSIDAQRQELANESASRTQGAEVLANTPMTLTYAGNQGFTIGNSPIRDSASGAWTSFTLLLSTLLLLLGYVLPWLLLGLIGLVIWRSPAIKRLRASLFPEKPAELKEPVAPTSPWKESQEVPKSTG